MPEPRRPLLEPLRELDAELGRAPLSPEAEARLRALLEGEPRVPARARLWIPVGAALVAAAAVLLLLLWPRTPSLPPSGRELGGFALLEGEARLAPDRLAVRCESERCTLARRGLGTELVLARGTRVRRSEGAVRLLEGEARVQVAKRKPGAAPVRILVSSGAIEVLGTRFQLWQRAAGGEVLLEEGRIRFRSEDGREVALAPGERLAWPLPPPALDASAPALDAGPRPDTGARAAHPRARRDAGRPLTTEQAESLLDEVERLRSQGRYADVARRLRDALPRIAEGAMRERFSFELGSVLSQQLRDAKAACAHWERHLRRFGAKRYGPEIRAAQRSLACPEPHE